MGIVKKIISIDVNRSEFNDFRYGWYFKCPECGKEIKICKYVFWNNYQEKEKKLKIIK